MTWIKTISYDDSSGRLRKIYDKIKGPENYIDNILLAHSLRPHTLEGHMALYKNVLHHLSNKLPKWFLEGIGVYVSLLNSCSYCVNHHFEGMRRLIGDNERSEKIKTALTQKVPEQALEAKEAALMDYACQLTENPSSLVEDDITALLQAGATEGEILEVNQVTAYFCYANRTVLGLGITNKDEKLGLSPSDSSNIANWQHR